MPVATKPSRTTKPAGSGQSAAMNQPLRAEHGDQPAPEERPLRSSPWSWLIFPIYQAAVFVIHVVSDTTGHIEQNSAYYCVLFGMMLPAAIMLAAAIVVPTVRTRRLRTARITAIVAGIIECALVNPLTLLAGFPVSSRVLLYSLEAAFIVATAGICAWIITLLRKQESDGRADDAPTGTRVWLWLLVVPVLTIVCCLILALIDTQQISIVEIISALVLIGSLISICICAAMGLPTRNGRPISAIGLALAVFLAGALVICGPEIGTENTNTVMLGILDGLGYAISIALICWAARSDRYSGQHRREA